MAATITAGASVNLADKGLARGGGGHLGRQRREEQGMEENYETETAAGFSVFVFFSRILLFPLHRARFARGTQTGCPKNQLVDIFCLSGGGLDFVEYPEVREFAIFFFTCGKGS